MNISKILDSGRSFDSGYFGVPFMAGQLVKTQQVALEGLRAALCFSGIACAAVAGGCTILGNYEVTALSAAGSVCSYVALRLLKVPYSHLDTEGRGLALVKAAEKGQVENAQALLDSGPTTEKHRGLALVKAAEQGQVEIVETLLAQSSISPKDLNLTLGRAVTCGNFKIVQALLKSGLITEVQQKSAFDFAAKQEQVEIVKTFLAKGSISPDDLNLTLGRAVTCGNFKIVQALLESGFITEEQQKSAFDLAAKLGQVEIVKTFLAEGSISQNHRDEALLKAVNSQNLKMVQAIFAHGHTVDEDFLGDAVVEAAGNNNLEIVKTLLAQGSISQNDQEEALDLAVGYRNLWMVKALLANGHRLDNRGIWIRDCAESGDFGIVQALLATGRINQALRGYVLGRAAANSCVDTMKILLKMGPLSDLPSDALKKSLVLLGYPESETDAFINLLVQGFSLKDICEKDIATFSKFLVLDKEYAKSFGVVKWALRTSKDLGEPYARLHNLCVELVDKSIKERLKVRALLNRRIEKLQSVDPDNQNHIQELARARLVIKILNLNGF